MMSQRANGLAIKPYKQSLIIILYAEGEKVAFIAAELKVSRTTVQRVLVRNGVQRRAIGRPKKRT